MIDRTAIIPLVLERLKTLPVGHCLDLRTYKRNRGLILVKRGPESVDVIEDGYEQAEFPGVDMGKLRKLLKTLLKREFPRSTKVRLYAFEALDKALKDAAERKTL